MDKLKSRMMIMIPQERYDRMIQSYDKAMKELEKLKKQLEDLKKGGEQ